MVLMQKDILVDIATGQQNLNLKAVSSSSNLVFPLKT